MVAHDPNFFEQWYFVCGASSGIGFAVAEALAKQGAKLFILSRSESNLRAAQEKLLSCGALEVQCLAYDLSDVASLQNLSQILLSQLNGETIRGLFLNGGGPSGTKVVDCNFNTLAAAHNLLTAGPFEIVKQLLPLLQRPGGVIISNGSGTLFEIQEQLALSGAYRRALETLLKTLAHEVGREGIRVLTLAPGYIETQRLQELADKLTSAAPQNSISKEAVWQSWQDMSALKRLGQPTEIAQASLFLFSDKASFFTGQTLLCDGGFIRGY